jgi:hypothetical protein
MTTSSHPAFDMLEIAAMLNGHMQPLSKLDNRSVVFMIIGSETSSGFPASKWTDVHFRNGVMGQVADHFGLKRGREVDISFEFHWYICYRMLHELDHARLSEGQLATLRALTPAIEQAINTSEGSALDDPNGNHVMARMAVHATMTPRQRH